MTASTQKNDQDLLELRNLGMASVKRAASMRVTGAAIRRHHRQGLAA